MFECDIYLVDDLEEGMFQDCDDEEYNEWYLLGG